MQQISFDKFQENPVSVFDNVLNSQEPISVSLGGEREVVVLDADDYRSIMETLYLLGNSANAERLCKGMQQHRTGQRKVIDVKSYMD
jgi:antitoxin YefM